MFVDKILVVYCATHPSYGFTGQYKDAIVYRYHKCVEFGEDEQWFNSIAKAENCVLLPTDKRSHITKCKVPRKNSGAAYRFGRSNVWFADDGSALPLSLKYLILIFIKNI